MKINLYENYRRNYCLYMFYMKQYLDEPNLENKAKILLVEILK